AAVAVASLSRGPVVAARAQALAAGARSFPEPTPFPEPVEGRPSTGSGTGASVFGVSTGVSPEWAAWANGVAVRELDYHDTFLAAEYSHPGDNIPPILAV